MNKNLKGKVVWHNGNAIILTGETERKHGTVWWLGTYAVGHRRGQSAVVLAGSTTETYEKAKPAITREQTKYDEFLNSLNK